MLDEQGSAAAIVDAAGRVLLIKENYGRRRYGFPGGALEPGEAPDDTVVRETREETGVEVEIDYLVGVYRLVNRFQGWLFRCHIVAGVPRRPDSGEIAEVGWFPVDAIPAAVTNLLHHALADVVSGTRGAVRNDLPVVSPPMS